MSATIDNKTEVLLQELLDSLQKLNKYELQMFAAWKEYRFGKEDFEPDNLTIQQIKDCIKVANKLLGKTEKDFL